jgi:hypothetical protein
MTSKFTWVAPGTAIPGKASALFAKLQLSQRGVMSDIDAFGLIVAELRSDRSWLRRVRRIEVSARFRAWCWRALSSAGFVAGAGVIT